MKRFFVSLSALFLIFTAQAFADVPSSEQTSQWFCTADGYDHNNQLRSMSGELKPTQKLAELSALRTCRGFYAACRVRSCFQQQ